MPALEVAAYGVVPVISRDSALEEAVGGLGISVDPLAVTDVARGILEACEMAAADRSRYSEALQLHARGYSADRFLAAWENLLIAEMKLEPARHRTFQKARRIEA
jgi:glycosyltransferase involved in cell wall biosynthesis